MLTEEQKVMRMQGIGGSDASAALGVSRYKTPVDLYLEFTGNKEREDVQNDFVHFGNVLEEVVANEYSRRTGHLVTSTDATFVHPKYPWMIGHVDRIIVNSNGAVLECKTASQYKSDEWGEEGSDDVPEEYLVQAAHYAIVLDAPYVDLAVLIGGNSFKIYKYQRRPTLEERIIELEKEFWNERVLKQIPPEPKTIEEANALWSSSSDGKIYDKEAEMDFIYLEEIRAKIKILDQQEKLYKAKIMSVMQEKDTLVDCAGRPLATWKSQKTKRLDQTLLKETDRATYDKYLKETKSRVFLMKERKS
jgi:putative phage-type endonuclease